MVNVEEGIGVPQAFCWTRFGTEAGEPIERIFERKEREREANDGLFLWGVGNSIRPSVLALTRDMSRLPVVFSPMLSRADPRDVSPGRTVVWTSGVGTTGDPCELPPNSVVTSGVRGEIARAHHYALVCSSRLPIRPAEDDVGLRIRDLSNWTNGTPVGASQVTCVVRHRRSGGTDGALYQIAYVAELVPPYFVRLENPIEVPTDLANAEPGRMSLETRTDRLLDLRREGDELYSRQLALELTG